MNDELKKSLRLFVIFLFFSFAFGYVLLWVLRLVNSFYEEMFGALFIGAFSFLRRRKYIVILVGGITGMCGWLIGLQLSACAGQNFGICFGTWFVTSIAIFLIIALQRLKRKKILKGFFIFILGVFIGLVIEILQILPAFIYAFKFQDFQAFAVMGASILIIPLANLLNIKKEEINEIKNNKA